MNEQEILAHFAPHTVYRFAGTVAELTAFAEGLSVNYIVSGDVPYFTSDTIPPTDDRITALIDNSQGVN